MACQGTGHGIGYDRFVNANSLLLSNSVRFENLTPKTTCYKEKQKRKRVNASLLFLFLKSPLRGFRSKTGVKSNTNTPSARHCYYNLL